MCCGPCATPIIPRLNETFEVHGFYYNPNIFPEGEYVTRLGSAKKVAIFNGTQLVVPEQERVEFFQFIGDKRIKPDRCIECYKQRLTATAKYARENGFTDFSTTLLISPFQYHDDLKKVGEEVAATFGLNFYYEDYRVHYKLSREIAKDMDLYLQKYCGCKFSRKRK